MCTEASLNARLRERPHLPVADCPHRDPRGLRAADEAVGVRLLQGAGLQDLLARRLGVPDPDGARAGLAGLLAPGLGREHVDQLGHLQASHNRVRARDCGDDGAGDGLGIPPRDPPDAVVLHAQVCCAVHKVHRNAVVLAEDALPNETPAGRAVHGRHRCHEAPRVSSDRGHPLGIEHGRAGGGGAAAGRRRGVPLAAGLPAAARSHGLGRLDHDRNPADVQRAFVQRSPGCFVLLKGDEAKLLAVGKEDIFDLSKLLREPRAQHVGGQLRLQAPDEDLPALVVHR
mmetsp:Transcript_104750/g.296030  ORF Transcript_104750/g.296030 Transcript_104750/m.296030 type:complete len:286 (+) Transcript_104750:155-1012(+)